MSRSQTILNALVDTRSTVSDIQSTDVHGAVLTLTRTAAQAITTAGTTLVWQSAIRQYQIAWAGTEVTIPADGWYHISIIIRTSIILNDLLYRLAVNGVSTTFASGIGDVDREISSAHFMRYFVANDAFRIDLIPSANCNVNLSAEGASTESPILHVVQLSGDVDV